MKSLFVWVGVMACLTSASQSFGQDLSVIVRVTPETRIATRLGAIQAECMEQTILRPLWKQAYQTEFDGQSDGQRMISDGELTHIAHQRGPTRQEDRQIVFTQFEEPSISIFEAAINEFKAENPSPGAFIAARLNLVPEKLGGKSIPMPKAVIKFAEGSQKGEVVRDAAMLYYAEKIEIAVQGSEKAEVRLHEKTSGWLTTRAINYAALKECLLEGASALAALIQAESLKVKH